MDNSLLLPADQLHVRLLRAEGTDTAIGGGHGIPAIGREGALVIKNEGGSSPGDLVGIVLWDETWSERRAVGCWASGSMGWLVKIHIGLFERHGGCFGHTSSISSW